uniref:Response regulator receiver protein n=1 Tax=Cyanothece sp. (strain PCC 7425 / ATCC 29141) TaxID=395961 RepID=B8HQY3_CYAP4
MNALIVDSTLAGKLLVLELEDFGVKAKNVDSITKARAEILKNKPDVLITELFMPDGYYLELSKYRYLCPVILLSSQNPSRFKQFINLTVDACLTKPIDPLSLLTTMKELLQGFPLP